MLVRCLYASRAAQPLSTAVLDAIMAESCLKNPRRGITGLLCHARDVFVQVIEGGRDEVCELFNAIVRDDRHVEVRLLLYEEIAERRFGEWSMGKVNVDDINPALMLRYSERPELNPFKGSGRATLALLDELVATGSIIGRGTG